jgi:hypothetical protein
LLTMPPDGATTPFNPHHSTQIRLI